MRKFLEGLVLILFIPLYWIGYIGRLAWLQIWLGWQDCNEILTIKLGVQE